MKILLVDDDKYLAEILSENLSKHNFVVDTVADGETGWYYASSFPYDLIVLDVLMPELDGLSLCKRLRDNGYSTPVLLLTARNSSIDKIKGLNAGADDYIVKPFDFEELIARIRAILRRDSQTMSPVLEWGNLSLDPSSRSVVYENRAIDLTPKQYALLELFLRNPGRVFSPAAIIDHLWSSEEIPGVDTVRTHIKELRQKLKAANLPQNIIQTVYGQGYCLKTKPIEASQSFAKKYPSKKSEQIKALAKIWEEYKEGFINRLEVFDLLEQELVRGVIINPKLQQEAELLAHSLAGTLGSFGKQRGSQLAIELERLLKTPKSGEFQKRKQFLGLLSALRQEIEQSANLVPEERSITPPAPIKPTSNVLIIDSDTKLIRELINTAPREIKIAIAEDLETAKNILTRQKIDAAIIQISFLKKGDRPLEESLSLIESVKDISPSLPILVISDRGNFSDRLLAIATGGDIFLEQPLNAVFVFDTLQKMLLRPASISAKVMVVDSDRQFLDSLPNLLSPRQFQLTTLDDPRLFWDFLVRVNPDLLIVNLEMPRVSGVQLCRIARSDPRWTDLPILLLTVDRSAKTQELIFASGANDYITKPILPEELARRIINCLN